MVQPSTAVGFPSNNATFKTDKMKHLAAYLLLTLGGNTAPSAADVKAVLESVGIEADSERLDKLISELEGKDLNEVRPPSRENKRVSGRTQLTREITVDR